MITPNRQATTEGLTKRAVEILGLLAEGLSDREIAERLFMTVNTVKWYNRQIYSILDVGSRTQAIARAGELQLLDLNKLTPSPQRVDDRYLLPKHNLPATITAFVERKQEIADIKRLLDDVRLLTLLGSPGTGKTRLALQIGWELLASFRDGVFLVSLAPLDDAALLPNSIAAALGVGEVHGQTFSETLKHFLRDRQLLLILDNFEHLLSGAQLVSELVTSAPSLKVLVTSRAPLNLYGETEYFVPPLSLPTVSDTRSATELDCEAVQLFVQRAKAAKPGFELTEANRLDIAKICVRLDGLPLAIELAAARSKLLSPSALLERLSNRLEMLVGGARDLPARQQTLRNTIDWSYDLLTEVEKTLFARLAVFSGGWSLEAAERVCSAGLPVSVLDILAGLVDQGLVQQYDLALGEPRFMMLETIHEYALERLNSSGETEVLRVAHAAYFIEFIEQAGKALDTINRANGISRLEIEQNNIRAVLAWSLAGDPEPGLQLVAAVGLCWRIRSYMVEGLYWAQQLLDKSPKAEPSLRSRALSSTGTLLACQLGSFAEADLMSQEALELAQRSGDRRTLADAWFARGAVLIEIKPSAAPQVIDNAIRLFRELDNRWELGRALNLKGELLRLGSDYEAASLLYKEALAIFRELDNAWSVNLVLANLAYIARHHGDLEQARALFAEALSISVDFNDRSSIAVGIDGIAGILGIMEQPQRAARLFGSADALRTTIGAHIQAADRREYDYSLDCVRSQLEPDTFEACWNEGAGMSMEQAVALALKPEEA
jgi:predicted ATPase/DNA-binding CsgD family transcriptional regulator